MIDRKSSNTRTYEIVLLNRGEGKGKNVFDIVEKLAKLLSLVAIPVVLGVGGWSIQSTLSERSVSKDYVALAVSILAKPEREAEPELRTWAVKLLNANSSVQFTPETSKKLSTGQLTLPTPMDISASQTRNEPVSLSNGELLVVKSPVVAGTSAIELTNGPGCTATYRWRYKELGKSELSGSGELFEQHVNAVGASAPTNLGGVNIEAGQHRLEWSCGSQSSGWIYSLPPSKVYVVRGKSLADFRL